jgi:hypothetical protein
LPSRPRSTCRARGASPRTREDRGFGDAGEITARPGAALERRLEKGARPEPVARLDAREGEVHAHVERARVVRIALQEIPEARRERGAARRVGVEEQRAKLPKLRLRRAALRERDRQRRAVLRTVAAAEREPERNDGTEEPRAWHCRARTRAW